MKGRKTVNFVLTLFSLSLSSPTFSLSLPPSLPPSLPLSLSHSLSLSLSLLSLSPLSFHSSAPATARSHVATPTAPGSAWPSSASART